MVICSRITLSLGLNVVDVLTSQVVYSASGAGEYALSNREVLGFGEPWYLGDIAMLTHADSKIELVLRPGGASKGVTDASVFDHLAFRVKDRTELEAWEARLQAMGSDLHITPAVGGVSINIEDPDGNDLELFVRTSSA